MAEKKGPICQDEALGEELKKLFFELVDSLEKELRKQKEKGYPVDKALKDVRKARRYVARIVR